MLSTFTTTSLCPNSLTSSKSSSTLTGEPSLLAPKMREDFFPPSILILKKKISSLKKK